MKNSNLKIILIIFLFALLSSCSGQITGELYYDTNNNQVRDLDEPGAGYMRVKVLKEGKELTSGMTLPDGTFAVKYPPGKKAKVCINVDTSTASLFNTGPFESNSSSTSPLSAKTSTIKATKDNYGSDEDDEENNSGSSGSSANDDDAIMSISSEGFCKTLKRGGSFSIPVKVDFEGSIATQPERLEKTCNAGEPCNLVIPTPDGCYLDKLVLPDGLSFGAPTEASSSTKPAKSKSSTVLPEFTVSKLNKNDVYLLVDEDLPDEKTRVTLEPKATCVGDQTISLKPIPLLLVKPEQGVPIIDVSQSITDQSSKSVTILVTIENKGDGALTDATLVARLEGNATWDSTSAGCDSLGTAGVRCRNLKIPAHGQTQVRVVHKNVYEENGANFNFVATLTYWDADGKEVAPIPAETVGIYIPPVEPTQ